MRSLTHFALPALGALALLAAAPAAAQQNVRCQSSGYNRSYCSADVRGGVRLVRQLSSARCERGRTWGTVAGRGIWVSNGCRADFAVGNADASRSREGHGRWKRGTHRDRDRDGMDDRSGSVASVRANGLCQTAVLRQVPGARRGSVTLSGGRDTRAGYALDWRAGNESGICRVDTNGQVTLVRNH